MIESFRCWELTTALALSLQEVGDPGMPLTVLSLSASEQPSAMLSSQLSTWPMAFIEDEDHPHTGAYDGANGCSVG